MPRSLVAFSATSAARAAEESDERASVAETVAEEALADLETADHARDQAVGERDELAATAAQLREELATTRAQAETAQAEWDRTSKRLQATAGKLVAKLVAARAQIDQFREQLATVRQEVADLAAARTELIEQLAAEREATACCSQPR
jgi:chromosome segregation ATPase